MRSVRVGLGLICVLAFANFVAWKEIVQAGAFRAFVLAVGQGDAILLRTPEGHDILVDGGPDTTVLSRLGDILPPWDRTIDLIILTHPDADHITGLVEVLEAYRARLVLWTGVRKDTNVFLAFQEAIAKEGVSAVIANSGQQVRWSRNSGDFLEVLYPDDSTFFKGPVNESSIILRVMRRGPRMLLTGDTTRKIERLLAESGADLKADVLKIAHHGSKTSTSQEFLDEVRPDVAVISVGKENAYGHPTKEVLERLRQYGIQIKRTDREGTVSFAW
ncbi:MAG: MBL fold metallo-hydrolase [Candidatus Wildermuthbacteria bacterium]|nr:MBL fold metallo-hydrolase [Candidatus Wildermuthbacteria bacterium]